MFIDLSKYMACSTMLEAYYVDTNAIVEICITDDNEIVISTIKGELGMIPDTKEARELVSQIIKERNED